MAAVTTNPTEPRAPETTGQGAPLFLVLSRKGLVDTQLTDPHTNNLVYRIRDTGRSTLSSKPDYEFFRTSSTGSGNELFVGSIRFGRTSTELSLPLTNTKTKGLKNIKPRHTPGSEYTWKTIKSQRKTVKDRWTETNDDGKSELFTNDEVIVLHLVNAAATSNSDEAPMCVVRLINTQPNGRFEFWAKEAWVNSGGDWNVLDELVVSAYANMETAKRELMKGMDPGSWRGAAMAG